MLNDAAEEELPLPRLLRALEASSPTIALVLVEPVVVDTPAAESAFKQEEPQ